MISILQLKRVKTNKRRLLLVRLDRLGDYILFRNFIEIIAKSEKYKDYEIYLCGNEQWRELSEKLDSIFITKYIWVNRRKFLINIFYKWQILSRVYNYGFEVAIESTYSREHLFGDTIIAVSNAPTKIGSLGEPIPKINYKRKLVTNKFYTSLIDTGTENMFEFYRNKKFFEKLLIQAMTITKPIISDKLRDSGEIQSQLGIADKFILICTGASQKVRRWSSSNYFDLIISLTTYYTGSIVITGTPDETLSQTESQVPIKSNPKIVNLIGKTTLLDLVKLISAAEIVITQDSAPIHIAAAFEKNAVCLSNGFHYGRFVPYPPKVYPNCKCIFPPTLRTENEEAFRFHSSLDINGIKNVSVLEGIKSFGIRN